MSITTITHLHAADGGERALTELLAIGRERMRGADGCESFEILRSEDDPCALSFLQRWSSHEAHDTAFAELIVKTGHLAKVLAAIDEPIVQHTYRVVT